MKEVEPCVRHTYVDAVRAHVRAQGVTCDNVDITFRPLRSAHVCDDIHQCLYTASGG